MSYQEKTMQDIMRQLPSIKDIEKSSTNAFSLIEYTMLCMGRDAGRVLCALLESMEIEYHKILLSRSILSGQNLLELPVDASRLVLRAQLHVSTLIFVSNYLEALKINGLPTIPELEIFLDRTSELRNFTKEFKEKYNA